MGDRLLKETEAAPVLGIGVKTLQSWRAKGYGPPFVRIGKPGGKRRAVRYPLSAINAYMADPEGKGLVPQEA